MGARAVIVSAIRRTALRWLLYAVAFVVLLSAINYGLGFVPFTPQWTAKRDRAENASLRDQVSSMERAAEGNAVIGQAVESYHTREVVYRDIQSQADQEAKAAPDADTPLSPERLARHRRNDERVCLNAPFTCTPLDAPLSGPPAVHPDGPAG